MIVPLRNKFHFSFQLGHFGTSALGNPRPLSYFSPVSIEVKISLNSKMIIPICDKNVTYFRRPPATDGSTTRVDPIRLCPASM